MTDRPEQRAIDLQVEVAGTPEEVWDAIASGPGIGSWFAPAEVEGGAGGTIAIDFAGDGSMVHEAPVVAWDPPRRLAYEVASQLGPPLRTEWVVTAASGSTCTVRLVCSGFGPGEEWDADLEGLAGGWPIFLEHLRLRRLHHPGRPARASLPSWPVPGPAPAAWAATCAALGVPADLAAGDRFEATAPGLDLAGTVATAWPGRLYVLLLDRPGPGTALLALEGRDEAETLLVSCWTYVDPATSGGDGVAAWLAARGRPAEAAGT